MPSFSFKEEFAPPILNGTKGGTIRSTQRCKPGDTMYLFTGMRTKKCKRIDNKECVAVVKVTVLKSPRIGSRKFILLNRKPLNLATANEFARADGFDSYIDFAYFFLNQYGLPYTGYWHVWDKNLLDKFNIKPTTA